MTKRGSSYEEVAREIGSVAIGAAVVWALIGAPGAPGVEAFLGDVVDAIAERALLAVMVAVVLCVSFVAYVIDQVVQRPETSLLALPVTVLFRILRTATLLAGIACAGMAALVPGTAVAYLLGFTGG